MKRPWLGGMKRPWLDDPTVVLFKRLVDQLELEVPRNGHAARTIISISKELRWAACRFVMRKYRNPLPNLEWDYSVSWPEGWASVRSIQ